MLENPLVYLTILSPLLATALWYIKLNGKKWTILTSLAFFVATVFLSFNPLNTPNVSHWLQWYFLFGLIYIPIFLMKYGFTDFNKVLAATLIWLFIASDYWEIPWFIYDFLGKTFPAQMTAFFGIDRGNLFWPVWWGSKIDLVWWVSHIRRVYTLACFVLFQKLVHLRLPRISKILLLGSMGVFAVLLHPAIIVPNWLAVGTIIRILDLYVFGVIAYIGIKTQA